MRGGLNDGGSSDHSPWSPCSDHSGKLGRSRGSRAYTCLVIVAGLSVYPFTLMIINSLKSNTQVLLNPAGLPKPATTSTYSEFFSGGGLRAFVNSIVIAIATTIGAVFLSALAGYAFAKIRFPGRTALFVFLLLTIMVPIQTAIPGFYLEFAKFHWLNTYQNPDSTFPDAGLRAVHGPPIPSVGT